MWVEISHPGSGWRRKGTSEAGEGYLNAQKRVIESVTISELDMGLSSDIYGKGEGENIKNKNNLVILLMERGQGLRQAHVLYIEN